MYGGNLRIKPPPFETEGISICRPFLNKGRLDCKGCVFTGRIGPRPPRHMMPPEYWWHPARGGGSWVYAVGDVVQWGSGFTCDGASAWMWRSRSPPPTHTPGRQRRNNDQRYLLSIDLALKKKGRVIFGGGSKEGTRFDASEARWTALASLFRTARPSNATVGSVTDGQPPRSVP